MLDLSVTDTAYEMIEQMEKRKRLFTFAVFGCFLAAVSLLGIDAFAYMMYSHQKGGLSDSNLILIAILASVCVGILTIGINRYIALKKLDAKLSKFEQLEEVIYKEILNSRMN
jgi:hypothetical protein